MTRAMRRYVAFICFLTAAINFASFLITFHHKPTMTDKIANYSILVMAFGLVFLGFYSLRGSNHPTPLEQELQNMEDRNEHEGFRGGSAITQSEGDADHGREGARDVSA